jgi:hypothetical protein
MPSARAIEQRRFDQAAGAGSSSSIVCSKVTVKVGSYWSGWARTNSMTFR